MKVLVTAFEPFNNLNNNYSIEVVNYLDGVTKVILDVVYDDCYKTLAKGYNLDEYDLLIAIGEARMRDKLTLELNAKNISSCSLKDNSGVLKKDEAIIEGGMDLIETKVQISKVKGLVQFSCDAGKFVCNNLYYHLLANYPHKSLFIHVPECNNDIKEYQKHAKTITNIIEELTKESI